jgi:hypothetical protein
MFFDTEDDDVFSTFDLCGRALEDVCGRKRFSRTIPRSRARRPRPRASRAAAR